MNVGYTFRIIFPGRHIEKAAFLLQYCRKRFIIILVYDRIRRGEPNEVVNENYRLDCLILSHCYSVGADYPKSLDLEKECFIAGCLFET